MSWQDFPLTPRDCALLTAKLSTQTLPQTVLLEGGAPEQRHALAVEIANALVCTGVQKPCGVCRACVKSKAHSHPDIKLYAPPKKNAAFKVEVSREIRQDAFVVPNDGHNKVYILEDSQNMNDSSENALLKILEEPPQGVFFVLTCTSASAMLPTVLSRAMLLRLTQTQETDFDAASAETAIALAQTLLHGTEMQTLLQTAELEKEREAVKEILSCLTQLFSLALCRKSGQTAPAPFTEICEQLANRFTQQKLYALYLAAEELELAAKHNANLNLLLTAVCYKLRRSIEK